MIFYDLIFSKLNHLHILNRLKISPFIGEMNNHDADQLEVQKSSEIKKNGLIKGLDGCNVAALFTTVQDEDFSLKFIAFADDDDEEELDYIQR